MVMASDFLFIFTTESNETDIPRIENVLPLSIFKRPKSVLLSVNFTFIRLFSFRKIVEELSFFCN